MSEEDDKMQTQPEYVVVGGEGSKRSRLPNGLTNQEESFCQNYVKNGGHNMRQVFIDSGYADPGTYWLLKVKKLLKKPKIQARIAEVEKNAALTKDMTKEVYVTMCLRLHDKAKADGDYKAANEALALVGKAMDYLVDKKVNMNANMTPKQALSPEERQARINALALTAGLTLVRPEALVQEAEFVEVEKKNEQD